MKTKDNIIYRLNSDLENLEWFWKSLRTRKLEQKYLYIWDWALSYYNDWNVFSIDEWVINDIENHKINFWVDIFKNLDISKSSLISLWCWNWNSEKKVLKILWKELDFFWVDSSEDMLKLLEENFDSIENNKFFD